MTEKEARLRAEMSRLCRSLFERGFSVGTAGNVSARLDDGLLITPTNCSLGDIASDRIARLDATGRHVDGPRPSKEIFLHRALYETRPGTGAVVHLHSTWATALSCRSDLDPEDCLPPLTPYVVMRVGTVVRVPYVAPGDPRAGTLIRELRGRAAAVLLANHGPIVAGVDLASAVAAAEELEETAKLAFILRGMPVDTLTAADVTTLETAYRGMKPG
ncbi:3-oxo-tetronate 4-phosphate decarboxylase [Jannaschia marina]|uniref:3-oxo-tetronate 4-phosphate decarboxylase n=1 Tax=Jannaschia marina TaxID=2741674 RepID=UPI002E29E39D|nr:3-oxo-tetronate 4-phosphate decarboxylase [Jannaschia marina]